MTMKTLADLKRKIRIGTKIEKTAHINIDNGVRVQRPPHPQGVREVVKVQTNAWGIAANKTIRDGSISWLDIPKASELTLNGNEFTITTWEGRLQMTYRLHD
jgi:hypothetical protein